MKFVSVNISLNHEDINQKLQKVREFKDLILIWAIKGSSPADCPGDILYILRDIDSIDQHFLLLKKKICNVKAREKGEEICYPEAE